MLPFRTYKNLRLESLECTAPGRYQLRVPQARFEKEDVLRVEETEASKILPFDTSLYESSLVETEMDELERGQVIRLTLLLATPPSYTPRQIPDACALVVDIDPEGKELDIQLSSQFVELEPVLDPYTANPPRYDYGFLTITRSQFSNLRVYKDAPKLLQYQSALFEAILPEN